MHSMGLERRLRAREFIALVDDPGSALNHLPLQVRGILAPLLASMGSSMYVVHIHTFRYKHTLQL